MTKHALQPNPDHDPYVGHVVHVLAETRHVQVYDLRPADGSNVNQVLVTFGPSGIGISGDLAPGPSGEGVWSRNVGGRGCREWFVGASSRDYLAEKFLHKVWTAESARAQLQAELERDPDPDRGLVDLLEDPWEQEHELYEAMQHMGCDTADGVYGHAYRESDIDLLVSLQARLRRHFDAVEQGNPRAQYDAVLQQALLSARGGEVEHVRSLGLRLLANAHDDAQESAQQWEQIATATRKHEEAATKRAASLQKRLDKADAVAFELAKWQATVAGALDLYKPGEAPKLDAVSQALVKLKTDASGARSSAGLLDEQLQRLRTQLSLASEITYGRFNLVRGWYVLEVAEDRRSGRGRWYGPDFRDYTSRLDWAGVYTEDEVASYRGDKGHSTPVPVETVLEEFEGRAAALRARILQRQRAGLGLGHRPEEAPVSMPHGTPYAKPAGLREVAVNLVRWLGELAHHARHYAENTTSPEARTAALGEAVRLTGWVQSLTDALRTTTDE